MRARNGERERKSAGGNKKEKKRNEKHTSLPSETLRHAPCGARLREMGVRAMGKRKKGKKEEKTFPRQCKGLAGVRDMLQAEGKNKKTTDAPQPLLT